MAIEMMDVDNPSEYIRPVAKSLIFLGTGTSGISFKGQAEMFRGCSVYCLSYES